MAVGTDIDGVICIGNGRVVVIVALAVGSAECASAEQQSRKLEWAWKQVEHNIRCVDCDACVLKDSLSESRVT